MSEEITTENTPNEPLKTPRQNVAKSRFLQLLQKAASQAILQEDPWAKYDLPSIPAERVTRHLYDPVTQSWSTDETIVKMQSTPFTHGAMRFCYRLKKRAQPPRSATNHRFHKHGWSRASNYVAKCYQDKGAIDTSEQAKRAVQNDILLQYEAQHWAQLFNDAGPPSKILFIRAYAIEFPNREGQPWFAVERFIAGTDSYGAGFVKHNTNSGFVDLELRRVTPQVFSAHSFYKSQGHRLVADIQGVGDLYTDPQVLSSDYRFGDGDLGPRGMALFFKTFRHCGMSDALGIPIFPLSKNELKCQAKYHADEVDSHSFDTGDNNDASGFGSRSGAGDILEEFDLDPLDGGHVSESKRQADAFQKLDLNRMKRRASLMNPSQIKAILMNVNSDELDASNKNNYNNMPNVGMAAIKEEACDTLMGTDKRSNLSHVTTQRSDIRRSLRNSLRLPRPRKMVRSKSEVDEVEECLWRAQHDLSFSLTEDFHRNHDGESLRPRKVKDQAQLHKSAIAGTINPPMKITADTRINLGKVHYQLATLHGMGRFPEVVPEQYDIPKEQWPSHDAFSVLFHLSYAAALHNAPACLSLARVRAGLGTHVSELLDNVLIPLDFEAAKDLLRRAMTQQEQERPEDSAAEHSSALMQPVAPRVAAGCLLFQILQDERHVGMYATDHGNDNGTAGDNDDNVPDEHSPVKSSTDNRADLMQVAEDTLQLFAKMEAQDKEAQKVKEVLAGGGVAGCGIQKGDRVEGNYFMEGTYYSATVLEVSETGDGEAATIIVTVQYDDDGSSETLSREHVRLLIPPTATQTNVGGPLSDDDAFGTVDPEDRDDKIPLLAYELLAELAELKAEAGEKEKASELFQEAAEGAMNDNKMKTATEWSLKAADLLE